MRGAGINLGCVLEVGRDSFVLGVGDPPGNPSQHRYFRHSLNFNAIPEPGTGLLVGLGLVATALRRRGARKL